MPKSKSVEAWIYDHVQLHGPKTTNEILKALESLEKMRNLIVIISDGQIHELWALIPSAHDKRLSWRLDQDYIQALRLQLQHKNPIKANEAKDALLFLNAEAEASLSGNFNPLEQLGVEVPKALKKQVYSARNSAQRDFVGNNQGAQDELTEFLNHENILTIGEMVDKARKTKLKLKRKGVSITEVRKDEKKKLAKKREEKALQTAESNKKALEASKEKYTAEAIKAFSAQYFKNKPQI